MKGMPVDPFASSWISLLMAWLCAAPIILAALQGTWQLFYHRVAGFPKWFVVWLTVCAVFLGPLPYVLLQLLLAESFPFQSFSTFIASFALGFYLPLVFGVLCLAGPILSFAAPIFIAVGSIESPRVSRTRLAIGAMLAPVASLLSYMLFLWLLPFATISTHWLAAEDVIRATNGPPASSYHFVLKHIVHLPIRSELVGATHSDRDMLRNHVASFYLGDRAYAHFVHLAYPALYDSLSRH